MNNFYSKKVLEHFRNPKNMGEMKNPDGMAVVGNPHCGDVMKMFIKVERSKGRKVEREPARYASKSDAGGYIKDVKFQTLGCAAAIATSSIITQMIKGKTLDKALNISNKAVAEALGGLPLAKMHCSVLASQAVKKAIENYQHKAKSTPEKKEKK